MNRTLDQALHDAAKQGLERLDAQLLLCEVLGVGRAWLYAHGDQPLDAVQSDRFEQLVKRRASGEPFAYIVGEKEFHGLSLRVTPKVLVPRPDTETLVQWALDVGPQQTEVTPATVLDLGTGSGAVALALKQARPEWQVSAIDLSPEALDVARGNGERLGLNVNWLQGSWWDPVASQRFHLVVSNPPYIAGDDPHLTALSHEPRLALTPEGDGLDSLRAIVLGAGQHLAPGGHLLLEHGHDQAVAVRQLLTSAGFSEVSSRQDLAGVDRCSGGRWT